MVDLYAEVVAVAGTLEEAGIPAALVGGLACSIYVEPRATEDLDFLILPEDWERVATVLKPHGWSDLSGPLDFQHIRIRRLTRIQGEDALVCDFLLADGDHRRGVEQRHRLLIDGKGLFLAPPESIIALKQGRLSAKDLGDIEGLRKLIHG